MKKIINLKNTISAILVLLIVVSTLIVSSVPDEIILFEGEKLNIGKFFTVEAQVDRIIEIRNGVSENDDSYLASVKLGGIVPVKNIKVSVQQTPMLVPCGNSIGVKLYVDGLMVVGIADFKNEEGKNVSPAKESGIKAGDLIKEVNGQAVYSAEELLEYVNSDTGKDVTLKVVRNNKNMHCMISPVKDETGEFKLGIWVRNSVAGIGTMTYYNPENNTYGALGHAIADSNTGVKVPVVKGEIVNSQILSVVKGEKGHPGELKGCFVNDTAIGDVNDNTDCGIYGSVPDGSKFNEKPLAAASRSQIKQGGAKIMCCIDGEEVKEYDIEIQKITHKKTDTKCMVIKVTDKELLEKTGGILQGMSGSPIIQDGKLVGAVTHVLVNDPTRGYGIFIENMLEAAS